MRAKNISNCLEITSYEKLYNSKESDTNFAVSVKCWKSKAETGRPNCSKSPNCFMQENSILDGNVDRLTCCSDTVPM